MRESEATIHEPTTPDHAAGGGRAADATGVWHACEDYATAEAL